MNWKGVQQRGQHSNSYDADPRDSKPKVLRPVGDINAAVSGDVQQQLMGKFIARVNEFDPVPALYSLRWLLRRFYEVEPKCCITLAVPDDDSCDALWKDCKR